MKILTDSVESLTFQDVVDFCSLQEREGVQVDYKSDLTTGSLSKHFAAFSNTLGGIILIGVEEDKASGLPVKYDGISVDRKNIERITQWANNVSPLPNYKIQPTNINNGKQFILIRIYEGDNTPYYVQNDGRIYIRTNDLTKELIDIASPDYSKLLYEKQSSARNNRVYLIDRGNLVRNSFFIKAEAKESPKTGITKWTAQRFLNAKSVIAFTIQPHYPKNQLTEPEKILNQVRDYQYAGHSYNSFPNSELNPIPEGAAFFSYKLESVHYTYHAIFSQGLLVDEFTIDKEDQGSDIYLDYLAGKFFVFLKSAQKYYKLFGYQGALEVIISMSNIQEQPLVDYTYATFKKKINALLNEYIWVYTLDTNKLLDEDKLLEEIFIFLKEFYWNLGFGEFNKENLILSFKKTNLLT